MKVIVAASALAVAILPLRASHAWGGYHWARTANPFTLQLGDNMSSAWDAYLAKASRDWNSPQAYGATSTPVLTAVVVGQSSPKRCGMITGTTQVCNANYGFNGWLGLASINISGVHITRGSAKMNDSYFNTATYNNPNERQHVVCQEIAHTFGLGHQSEDGSSQNSCMDYFSNTGANATSTLSTTPNVHDFDQLNAIYQHLDSSSTVIQPKTTTSGVDIDTDDPKSWGALVSQSRNGRSSTYDRVNRDGSRTITHVFWTEEAAERCPGCDHRYERHDDH